jgi:hypothetical protein
MIGFGRIELLRRSVPPNNAMDSDTSSALLCALISARHRGR